MNLKAKEIVQVNKVFPMKYGLSLLSRFLDGYLISASSNHIINIKK